MRFVLLLPLIAVAGCSAFGRGGAASAATPPISSSPPASFVRSTAESQVTRTIDVRDGLTRPQAMRALVDALSQRFTVEVTDPRAGFAMTAWQASLLHDGVPDLRYRTRVTARFLGDDWKKVQLRDEANWARGEEWDVGFDAAQLDSATADVKAKIGKRT